MLLYLTIVFLVRETFHRVCLSGSSIFYMQSMHDTNEVCQLIPERSPPLFQQVHPQHTVHIPVMDRLRLQVRVIPGCVYAADPSFTNPPLFLSNRWALMHIILLLIITMTADNL